MSTAYPFGLSMGATKEDINSSLEEIVPFIYLTDTVPKPHPAFNEYYLKITPTNGLSWIKAIGKTVSTSAYGSELRDSFESMLGKLTKIYGKNKLFDFLPDDSIWNEPRDWMQSLLSKERQLCAFWEKKNGATLSPPLSNLFLGVSVLSTDEGFIVVEYKFENDEIASAELEALEDDAL